MQGLPIVQKSWPCQAFIEYGPLPKRLFDIY